MFVLQSHLFSAFLQRLKILHVTRADPSGMARHGYPSMHVTYSVANRRSRPIKYNSITFRIALNKQKVIAILGATATVVRGADGHKTNLFFGKRNQTNHIQSGCVLLCYMHQATRYCAVIVYHINTILRFKVKTCEKTRWEVSLQQHPQCPFSIMLGTPLQQAFPGKHKVTPPPGKGLGLGFFLCSCNFWWIIPFNDQIYTLKGWIEVNLGQNPSG